MRITTSRATTLGLVLFLLLASTPSSSASEGWQPEPNGTPTRAVAEINNGLFTTDFPSVGQFLSSSGVCTATLIGCRTALTAAHCVCDSPPCGAPPGGFVYFQNSGLYDVVGATVHPGWAPVVGLGRNDLAVLRLSAPVAGVRPSRLNSISRPQAGVQTALVGFGTTQVAPSGIKRAGVATLSNCLDGNPIGLCYQFLHPIGDPGSDSTACPGDSGGPMFASNRGQLFLVGATSGGSGAGAFDCSAPVEGIFSDVFSARAWIQAQAGGDLGQSSCGGLPSAGSPSAPVAGGTGFLDNSRTEVTETFVVPSGTRYLLVTLNGELSGNDFDLLVRRGAVPTLDAFDCIGFSPLSLESCWIESPTPGTWHLQARQFSGSGLFQLTATAFLQESAPCVPDAQTACLQGGRFEVKIDWNNASDAGTAQVMSFGGQRAENNDSAFYSFQSPTSFEMGVKMLDACIPLFGNKFWVFISGLTDQGWQVVVRDTQTGATKTYSNANGELSNTFADTSAFDCG